MKNDKMRWSRRFGALMVAATSVGLTAGDSPPLMKKFTHTLINNHMILQADIQSKEFSLECPYDKGQEGEGKKWINAMFCKEKDLWQL